MMSEMECLIGKIITGFVRTEYLISQITSELGITTNRTDLFAERNSSKKFKNLIEKLAKLSNGDKQVYISYVREFDALREQRNTIVHSLVLENSFAEKEYKFHNYLKVNGMTSDKSQHYNLSELQMIEKKIIDIHNGLATIHFK